MGKYVKYIKPHFSIGLIILFVIIILPFFIIDPFHERLGLWTVIGIQALVLACAILFPFIFKWNLREVFPFRKFKIRDIFGIFLLWVSQLWVMALVNWTAIYLFPNMSGALKDVNNFTVSLTPLASYLIAAVLAPVCEELLNRGTIQYTFSDVKNKWIKVIALGFMFGAFRANPTQFLGTSVLGMFLVYIMAEKGNLFLTMLFHFIQNSFVHFTTLSTSSSQTATSGAYDSETALTIGFLLILGAGVIFIMICGEASYYIQRNTTGNIS